jgi:quercetin dioxygenase-like cupin family protein
MSNNAFSQWMASNPAEGNVASSVPSARKRPTSVQLARREWLPLLSVPLLSLSLLACGSSKSEPHVPELRLAPDELSTAPEDQSQIGSAKVTGIHTRVVLGTPEESGFYSIMLFIPPETTIQPHSHRDDRVAAVLSGTWKFAYGDQFDPSQLKELAPGSVYSEPGGAKHFALTGAEPVVLHITGNGPTDTHYVNPADDPKNKQ